MKVFRCQLTEDRKQRTDDREQRIEGRRKKSSVESATGPTYIGGHGGPPYFPKKMASNFMKFHTRFQRTEVRRQKSDAP